MARDYAKFNVEIWNDADFRALPAAAQHLYIMIWTHVTLSYCGVADWRPVRLAALAEDLTVEHVEATATILEDRRFLIIDRDTEEVLVRSWVRFDGLMRQPRLAVSFARAYQAVTSRPLREVVVYEALKLQTLEPDLPAWGKPEVLAVLTSVSAKPPSVSSKQETVGGNENRILPSTFYLLPSTFSTPLLDLEPESPAPPADAGDDDEEKPKTRRKPERPLPASWSPNVRHHEMAAEKHLDIATSVTAFRNHAETHDRRARDWDAAFRTWLNKTPAQQAPARDDWMFR